MLRPIFNKLYFWLLQWLESPLMFKSSKELPAIIITTRKTEYTSNKNNSICTIEFNTSINHITKINNLFIIFNSKYTMHCRSNSDNNAKGKIKIHINFSSTNNNSNSLQKQNNLEHKHNRNYNPLSSHCTKRTTGTTYNLNKDRIPFSINFFTLILS